MPESATATADAIALHELTDSGTNVRIVDVRTPGEFESVHILDGGMLGWEAAGLPVNRGTQRWDLERQVRLVAGSLVLSSILASIAAPRLKWLAAGIGGGLTFAVVPSVTAPAPEGRR